MDDLEIGEKNGVLWITFNRPETLNAVTPAMETAFIDALERAERDDDVRCVVVSGNGRAFSAGRDVDIMRERFENDVDAAELRTSVEGRTAVLARRLYTLALPTIASVDGPATGMGFSIAMACDVVVGGSEAKFGATFRNVGFGPDSGLSYTLQERIGPNRTLELFYTGELVDAERAADLGILDRFVPSENFETVVTGLAEDIASGPTEALAAAKRLVQANGDRGFGAAVDAEMREQVHLYGTHDHEEGVHAFLENRDPKFEGC